VWLGGQAPLAKSSCLAYIADMENIFTYMVYGGAVVSALGLIGLGISVFLAIKLKKDAPGAQETKERMQLLVALNTGSLGTSFFGLALVVVGVLVS